MDRFANIVLSLCSLLLFSIESHAQPWLDKLVIHPKSGSNNSRINFYQIQEAYYQYEHLHEKDKNQIGNHEDDEDEQFRRWEWFNAPRVYPTGDFPKVKEVMAEYERYLRNQLATAANQFSSRTNSANWVNLPSPDVPTGGKSAGMGRVNCLTFMPGENTTMFAGTACGGVWKTTDSGLSWTVLNTDQLPSLSITSIVIDPTNTQHIFIATGDNFTGFPISGVLKQGHFSAGIYKSVNGGETWTLAGMPKTQADGFIPQQMILDPVTPSTLLLASNTGIWRSINSGTNWTLVQSSGTFYNIEFNPLNHNVVFATNGLGLWRSNNNGVTWTYKGGGYPNQLGGRVSLAVTPADTNYIYVWGPTAGFKRSVNGGTTLVTVTDPNPIAQPYGYVDRALGVSKTNAMHVMAGGLIAAKSLDGGITWAATTDWEQFEEPDWVHADIKKIVYEPGSGTKLYIVNDGGISVSSDNGITWDDISHGLQIAEIYKIANSPFDADTIYYGAQDLGTYRWDATNIVQWLVGGDGFQPLVNPANALNIFASFQIGNLQKSIDGGAHFVSASPGQYLWDPAIKMNPLNPNTMIVGCTGGVKKSIEAGLQGSYVNLSGNVLTNIIALDITKADTQYIYAASINQMIRSTDGGDHWVDITAGLPVASAAITYITVSTNDPDVVYVSFSGYSANNKIFRSANGGNSWTNYSGSQLPNVPVNCIMYMDGSNDDVYIGTDFGVFYRNADSADWIAFNTGLPNVIVNHLAVQYGSLKLRAGTYGRGLWESNLAVDLPSEMTWEGSVSSDWNNLLNWTPHGVPIFSQDVIIPDVSSPNFDPIVNVTGLRCRDLTLLPGAVMTVPEGKQFRTDH